MKETNKYCAAAITDSLPCHPHSRCFRLALQHDPAHRVAVVTVVRALTVDETVAQYLLLYQMRLMHNNQALLVVVMPACQMTGASCQCDHGLQARNSQHIESTTYAATSTVGYLRFGPIEK